MDRYQKFDTYGFDLLDDPTLRTTAKSYEFKYVPTDQLERIIQTVHKNRLKVKKNKMTEDFSRPQTSKIAREQKSSKRFAKSVIKTPTSTVRILNPMKVTRESSNTSSGPPIVPKIRIMTDDEIQKVVENAVREVMQSEEVPKSQRSNRKEKCEEFVSKYFESFQGANNLEKDLKLDLSPMRKETEEHVIPERQERSPKSKAKMAGSQKIQDMKSPTTSNRVQRNKTSSRERSSASSVRSSQASTRTSAGPPSTPRWETVNESGGSNKIEALSEQDVKSVFSQSPASTAHEMINSRHSISSRSFSETNIYKTEQSTSESDSESESSMYHDEGQERLEGGADLSQHKEMDPYQVSSQTSREFRALLESQAILPTASELKRFNNKENDNQSFGEKLSSDDDREDEENLNDLLNQENLFPIIHIRRPTPIESDGSEQESCFGQKFDLGPEFPRLDAGDASKNTDNVEGSSKHSGPKPDLTARSPLKSSANKKQESPARPLPSARQTPRKITKPKDSARSPTSGRDQSKSPKIGSSRANELRQEAISIFSKITLYQEKIIELLDGIRRGLLNQSLSNGPSEKKRRDRFVIEFTARFKRNYLYQLERMFDDLEKISREQFFCKFHNENPMKICVIYGVLHQATTTYLKQIKHFLQDQFPRKLDVLLMYIIDITKLCIHKKVFDKDDALTQSLIMRCEDLLVFLADMEARKQQTLTPKKRQKAGATPKQGFSGWQAKPSLSMYEPQNPQPPPARGVTRKKSGLTQKNSPPPPTAKSKINQPSKTLLDPKSTPSKVKNLSTTKKSSSKTLRKQLKPKQDKPTKDFSNDEHKAHNKSLQEEIFSPEPRPADEGSREVIDPHSEATSTYIEARQETKAEKDDTNMKDSVFEVLKTITEQELNKLLAPLVTNLGSMLNENIRSPFSKRPMAAVERSNNNTRIQSSRNTATKETVVLSKPAMSAEYENKHFSSLFPVNKVPIRIGDSSSDELARLVLFP